MSNLRPFRMVVALDDAEYAENVREHAIDQASRHGTVALHVASVARDPSATKALEQRLTLTVVSALEELRGSFTQWTSRLHIRTGKAHREIADLVAELDADMLVIGRFGLHATLLHESIADRVIGLVGCPVLVVGLGAHELEPQPQCPRCVEVRTNSAAERWFCDVHAAPGRIDLTLRLPSSTTSVRGGGVW